MDFNTLSSFVALLGGWIWGASMAVFAILSVRIEEAAGKKPDTVIKFKSYRRIVIWPFAFGVAIQLGGIIMALFNSRS